MFVPRHTHWMVVCVGMAGACTAHSADEEQGVAKSASGLETLGEQAVRCRDVLVDADARLREASALTDAPLTPSFATEALGATVSVGQQRNVFLAQLAVSESVSEPATALVTASLTRLCIRFDSTKFNTDKTTEPKPRACTDDAPCPGSIETLQQANIDLLAGARLEKSLTIEGRTFREESQGDLEVDRLNGTAFVSVSVNVGRLLGLVKPTKTKGCQTPFSLENFQSRFDKAASIGTQASNAIMKTCGFDEPQLLQAAFQRLDAQRRAANTNSQ